LSEKDEKLIKNLTKLTSFICENENKIDFLEKSIGKSTILDEKIKHKIYMQLLKLSCENKTENEKRDNPEIKDENINEKIKKFISELYYPGSLKPEKLNDFIDYLGILPENEKNEKIEGIINIDQKYIKNILVFFDFFNFFNNFF